MTEKRCVGKARNAASCVFILVCICAYVVGFIVLLIAALTTGRRGVCENNV